MNNVSNDINLYVVEIYASFLKTQTMPTMFSDKKYPFQLLRSLASSRERGEFCDVTFTVEENIFPAHKCVMASSSDYFAAMFDGNFKENHMETIPLNAIQSEAFDQIIKYIYSGILRMSQNNVKGLYIAADILQYSQIKKKCITFIQQDINPDNCVDYLMLTNLYGLDEVWGECIRCTFLHFDLIAVNDSYLGLPYHILETLVQSDEVRCEEKNVLDVVLKWLMHHPDVTETEQVKLFGHIRHGLISSQDEDVQEMYQTLNNNNNLGGILNEMHPTYIREQYLNAEKWNHPRGPLCLVAVGGNLVFGICNTITAVTMERDLETGIKTIFQKELSHPISHTAVVVRGHFMYVIGGSSGGPAKPKAENTVSCYDSIHDTWNTKVPMTFARYGHAAAVTDSFILVIGGYNQFGKALSSVEKYILADDKWKVMKDYIQPICDLAACTFKEQIYISGGHDGNDNIYSMLCSYQPDDDRWHIVGCMELPRHSHGMCTDGKTIFAIGGRYFYNGAINTSFEIDAFEESDNGLTLSDPQHTLMPYSLHNISCIVCGGYIYVIGGYGKRIGDLNPNKVQKTILKYHIETQQWMECKERLPYPVENTACALIVFPHCQTGPKFSLNI